MGKKRIGSEEYSYNYSGSYTRKNEITQLLRIAAGENTMQRHFAY